MLAAVRWILTFSCIHCFCCRFPLRITQRKSEALQTRESLLGYAVLSSARAAMQLRKTDGCGTDRVQVRTIFYLNHGVFHTPRVRFPFTTTQCTRPCCSAASFLKRSQGVGAGAGAPFLVYSPLLFVSSPSVLLPTPRRILLLFFKTGFDASRSVQAVAKKKKKLLARKRFRVGVMSRACVCVCFNVVPLLVYATSRSPQVRARTPLLPVTVFFNSRRSSEDAVYLCL